MLWTLRGSVLHLEENPERTSSKGLDNLGGRSSYSSIRLFRAVLTTLGIGAAAAGNVHPIHARHSLRDRPTAGNTTQLTLERSLALVRLPAVTAPSAYGGHRI